MITNKTKNHKNQKISNKIIRKKLEYLKNPTFPLSRFLLSKSSTKPLSILPSNKYHITTPLDCPSSHSKK